MAAELHIDGNPITVSTVRLGRGGKRSIAE
jgi:hypothetical protein